MLVLFQTTQIRRMIDSVVATTRYPTLGLAEICVFICPFDIRIHVVYTNLPLTAAF